ncbi:hypothetical protein [Ruminococcus sp.]|uniref:hypothetical protein n=1 Tax=Ruminococcus sp. TaxID=41978 RepID=UPI0025EAA956|nr:hypothetical protein [Ruminococcus sp.]MBR1431653.1 hypothetical protein [Ruminococcus sp.]
MRILLDFDDCIKNPSNYIGLPIYVDYGSSSRCGYIASVFSHSIRYFYYDDDNGIYREGKIFRKTCSSCFNRVSLLCNEAKINK